MTLGHLSGAFSPTPIRSHMTPFMYTLPNRHSLLFNNLTRRFKFRRSLAFAFVHTPDNISSGALLCNVLWIKWLIRARGDRRRSYQNRRRRWSCYRFSSDQFLRSKFRFRRSPRQETPCRTRSGSSTTRREETPTGWTRPAGARKCDASARKGRSRSESEIGNLLYC